MQTLYIDVYFLINFTLDMLSMYFASKAAKFRVFPARLSLCGAIGGAAACLCVFLPRDSFMPSAILLLSAAGMTFLVGRGARPLRLLRLGVAFLLFETIFGGALGALYAFYERRLVPHLSEDAGGAYNRRILLLTVLVLLTIGGVKLVLLLFSGQRGVRTVRLRIVLCGAEQECEALVDSGNLLRDPMNLSPVMLIKARDFRGLLPRGTDFSEAPENMPLPWRNKMRLIPIRKGESLTMRVGFLPDSITLCDRPQEALALTVAVDPEEGGYGGYCALIPSAALDLVI